MFDENQKVKVRWHSTNKSYFIGLGIPFTKIGNWFEVPAKLLPPKSSFHVKCICDYCGKEYETTYAIYNKSVQRGKIACNDCKQKKREESFVKKYGVNSPGASEQCRKQAKRVMKEKYGHEYALQTVSGREHFKKAMIENYGVDNPVYHPELAEKARISAFKNGTVPASKPEKEIVKMLISLYGKENCIPGYPVDKTNLDCLLTIDDIKIDVEYDGKYWHQDKDRDRRRNHWMISKGYKVLRILADARDNLPSIERLKEEVDYLLDGHDLGYIDMND